MQPPDLYIFILSLKKIACTEYSFEQNSVKMNLTTA